MQSILALVLLITGEGNQACYPIKLLLLLLLLLLLCINNTIQNVKQQHNKD